MANDDRAYDTLRVIFVVMAVFATFFVVKAAYQERQVRRMVQSIAREVEVQKNNPTVPGLALVAEAQEKLKAVNQEMGRLTLENLQLRTKLQAVEEELAQLKGKGNGENRKQ